MPFKFNPFTDKLDEVTAAGPSAGVSTINTIAPTGGGNFTLTPGAGISITPGVNSVTIADTNTPVSEQQIYYVAKSGNDANSGLNIENAVLTFGHAITLATAQTPSSTNRFAIWCFDDGIYTEDVVGVPYVDIFAPNATIVATATGLTVADNSNYTLLAMQVPDAAFGVIKVSTDTATSWVNIAEMTCAGTGVGFVNASNMGGVLQCEWKTLTINDGVGVGDISTGHMHVRGGDIYIVGITGNAIALGRANPGSIVGHVDHILIEGAGAAGTALFMQEGLLDLNINTINATAAISIDGTAGSCTLNLFCNDITGAQAATNGAVLNIWSPIPSGSNGQFLSSQGPGLPPQWVNSNSIKITEYLTNDIWTVDPLTQVVEVFVFGGGGGGGSGRQGASGSASGGSGGGSGGYSYGKIAASLITSPQAITIAAFAAGGLSQASSDTNGNAGTAGNNSSFGALFIASGGGAGGGGTSTTITGGSAGVGTNTGTVGGNANSASSGNAGHTGILSTNYTAAGAAGGSASVISEFDGGVGGNVALGGGNVLLAGGTVGAESSTIDGGAGSSLAASSVPIFCGGGGGGGGGGQKVGLVAGIGGAGGFPSGGGGGGGGSLDGTNSGAGGQGAPGAIWVIEYF